MERRRVTVARETQSSKHLQCCRKTGQIEIQTWSGPGNAVSDFGHNSYIRTKRVLHDMKVHQIRSEPKYHHLIVGCPSFQSPKTIKAVRRTVTHRHMSLSTALPCSKNIAQYQRTSGTKTVAYGRWASAIQYKSTVRSSFGEQNCRLFACFRPWCARRTCLSCLLSSAGSIRSLPYVKHGGENPSSKLVAFARLLLSAWLLFVSVKATTKSPWGECVSFAVKDRLRISPMPM